MSNNNKPNNTNNSNHGFTMDKGLKRPSVKPPSPPPKPPKAEK